MTYLIIDLWLCQNDTFCSYDFITRWNWTTLTIILNYLYIIVLFWLFITDLPKHYFVLHNCAKTKYHMHWYLYVCDWNDHQRHIWDVNGGYIKGWSGTFCYFFPLIVTSWVCVLLHRTALAKKTHANVPQKRTSLWTTRTRWRQNWKTTRPP